MALTRPSNWKASKVSFDPGVVHVATHRIEGPNSLIEMEVDAAEKAAVTNRTIKKNLDRKKKFKSRIVFPRFKERTTKGSAKGKK